MRAVVVHAFGPVESARVEEIADPTPTAGEVLVRVEASETNFPDILVMEGLYQVKPPLPFSPGKTAAGSVVGLGDGTTSFSVGDRVAVQVEYGAYAELIRAPASACFAIPDKVGTLDAAALGLTYQTIWFALKERAFFAPPESVLVLGAAGGLGVAGIQLAKALGSQTVIGATRGRAKEATVRAAGADHVIDVSGPDIRDRLRDEVKAVTGGEGVDIVLDPVGGRFTDAALRSLAWQGRLVVLGFAAGDIPSIRANYLLVKNISVSGLQWSDYRDRKPELMAAAQREIFDLNARGLLRPIVSEILPLEGFASALAKMRAGEAEGKIMLRLGDPHEP